MSLLRLATIEACVCFLLACAGEKPAGDANYFLASVDTIIQPGNEVLLRPTELTLDDHGLLYIADAGANSILVFDSGGTFRIRIGKEGAGPGELQAPRSLQADGDSLRLLDAGNARFTVFTLAGQFVRTQLAPGSALTGAVALSADGAAVISLGGKDSALAQRMDPSGELGSRFGVPLAPVPSYWDFSAIKQEIRDGRVPAVMRNLTLPVMAPHGPTWLCLSAEGIIERYSTTDSLVWRTALDEPEFLAIRDEFFQRNRADSSANRLYSLSLFAGAQALGNEVWVLVRQPTSQGTLILIVDRAGNVRARLRAPDTHGIRGFVVDQPRRLLYLLAYDDAAVLRITLPASAVGAT